MMRSEWKGRRVFLTGHTGFKGGWLALCLTRAGAVVRGYALNPSTTPSLFASAGIGSLVDDLRGDLLDSHRLTTSLHEFSPEVVFHLAAQPIVRRSYADPVGTYATNVMGTVHLLDALRNLPSVRAVVVVTTDKCYENREWHWGYRETDPLGGYDPYSSSKACVELLSAAYRTSYFSPKGPAQKGPLLATARAGNVIGGGDWSEDRLLPDLVRGFTHHHRVPIRNPRAIRPWQHVLEPLAGYILLAERLLAGESRFADAWNFGPCEEDAWPVGRVATAVTERWNAERWNVKREGEQATWFEDGRESDHEAGYLKLDSSKARAELKWKPRLGLMTALEWTTDWYRTWRTPADMQSFSIDQIAAYEKMT